MPFIEDYVRVSTGACILRPIVIKRYSIVGANSVVTKNVDEYEVVVGIPAKFLTKKCPNTYENILLNIKK